MVAYIAMVLLVLCVWFVACSDRYGEIFGWLTAAGVLTYLLLGGRL